MSELYKVDTFVYTPAQYPIFYQYIGIILRQKQAMFRSPLRFYRAMHFSAFARSCDRMSSVRPSVRPSVRNVGDL